MRGALVTGPPKTGNRTVTLPAYLAEILAEHMAAFRSRAATCSAPPAAGRFAGPFHATGFFQPAVSRARMAPLRFHDLRHTAAALAISTGANAMEVKTLLGHSSITTTFNVYGHLLPGLEERLSERIDDVARQAAVAVTTAPYLPLWLPRTSSS